MNVDRYRSKWPSLVLAALLAAVAFVLLPAAGAVAAENPSVTVDKEEAGKGGEVTVTGKGWRPGALVMILICGQNMIGGTNSCANPEGVALNTDDKGGFKKKIPVAEPPKACPCVINVATVTGAKATAQVPFKVAGHPVKPLPDRTGGGKLAVLAATRLEGDSGLLNWFGSPQSRKLVVTMGNLGSAPVKDPVFKVGTSHGVFAPQWEEQQWKGTIAPGQKAQVELTVQLDAGAHGDYLVSLQYGGKVLAEQPWGVPRPWGVTLFWILLCIVVPAAVFRIGMAVVDRVRPRRKGNKPRRFTDVTAKLPKVLKPTTGVGGEHKKPRIPRRPGADPDATAPVPTQNSGATANGSGASSTATLPWFTPDTAPAAPAQHSAPQENRPDPTGTSERKGTT
ncbi:hypothetical protein [Streptomyces indicus]|uniref:Neocarzinostatin family protein n=1 Tax=Streptomyces indicus TaxID=417292 RepID=A0A1G9I1R1_9ACTN|nr:hypothetical protein [Streptomyces indicus]SDL19187.1 hypothetical protein SAMN05421806_12139 [Streptomyces indicus]